MVNRIFSKRTLNSPVFRMAVLMIVVLVAGASLQDSFLTLRNVQSICKQLAEYGILAVAVFICMLSGGIDLSVVYIANLCAIVIGNILIATVPAGATLAQSWHLIVLALLVALALGGLCGGILTAIVSEKLKIQNSYVLLLICSIAVAVMGISLFLNMPAIVSYWAITLMSFTAMGASTLFMVQIYTLVQTQSPPQLVGKIMAALISIAMCGQPIGQAIYGVLFDIFAAHAWVVLVGAAIAAFLISFYSKKIFGRLEIGK